MFDTQPTRVTYWRTGSTEPAHIWEGVKYPTLAEMLEVWGYREASVWILERDGEREPSGGWDGTPPRRALTAALWRPTSPPEVLGCVEAKRLTEGVGDRFERGYLEGGAVKTWEATYTPSDGTGAQVDTFNGYPTMGDILESFQLGDGSIRCLLRDGLEAREGWNGEPFRSSSGVVLVGGSVIGLVEAVKRPSKEWKWRVTFTSFWGGPSYSREFSFYPTAEELSAEYGSSNSSLRVRVLTLDGVEHTTEWGQPPQRESTALLWHPNYNGLGMGGGPFGASSEVGSTSLVGIGISPVDISSGRPCLGVGRRRRNPDGIGSQDEGLRGFRGRDFGGGLGDLPSSGIHLSRGGAALRSDAGSVQ